MPHNMEPNLQDSIFHKVRSEKKNCQNHEILLEKKWKSQRVYKKSFANAKIKQGKERG